MTPFAAQCFFIAVVLLCALGTFLGYPVTTMASKSYQGHRNYNAWNVALYLANDEGNYRLCQAAMAKRAGITMEGGRKFNADDAANMVLNRLPSHTPDGVRYTRTNVRLALQHWEN